MKQSRILMSLLALPLLFGAGLAMAGGKTGERVDQTHEITREAPSDTDTSRVQPFSHQWFDSDPFSTAVDSCSGSCSGNTCTCTGSLSCCLAGCAACFKVLDEL